MNFLRTLPTTLFLTFLLLGSAKAQISSSIINEVMTGKVCDSSVSSGLVNGAQTNAFYKIYKTDKYGYVSNMHTRVGNKIMSNNDIKRNDMHQAIVQTVSHYLTDSFQSTLEVYYFYDTKGNMLREVTVAYMYKSIVFDTIFQAKHTFDADNYLIETVFQMYLNGQGKWLNSNRITNTNNAKGSPLVSLSENLEKSVWKLDHRTTNTYDDQNRLITSVYEFTTKSKRKPVWKFMSKTIYAYDKGNSPVSILSQGWNGKIKDWQNSRMESKIEKGTLTYSWYNENWLLIAKEECPATSNKYVPN